MVVPDVDEMFMPLLDGFFVKLSEAEEVIDNLMLQVFKSVADFLCFCSVSLKTLQCNPISRHSDSGNVRANPRDRDCAWSNYSSR